MSRTDWFKNARFGMFIHWGLYAIPAAGEWIFANRDWKDGEYQSLIQQFDPVDYDPAYWAELAKAAGMKYVVFTTKHHDGFCMFDSKYTDYKITNTPYGKDVTRMLVDAFHEAGLKVGFYHSLPDWTHPGYADEESPEFIQHKILHTPTPEQRRDFLDYLYHNVEQLMTEYGKIDLLFFDYTSRTKAGIDYFERDRLLEMIYRHQPEIIVNDRLAYYKDDVRDFDYYTPEVAVMNQPIQVKGKDVVWETCATMNGSWGYTAGADQYKNTHAITSALMGCVSNNGNLLLNVGPDRTGKIPEGAVDALKKLAEWNRSNGEAVTGCGKSEYQAPFGTCYTQKGNVIYCYLLTAPLGDLILPGLRDKVEKVTLLRTGDDVKIIMPWGYELLKKDDLRIRPQPSMAGDVLKIELKA